MALNKRRTASVSASTAPVSSEVASPNQTPDLGALQAALASIVQLVTEQASKLGDLTSELESIKARLDAVEAAMDEDESDGEDTDEELSQDDDEDDEDEYTADDIDPMKVNEQLHQFDANEQKEILSIAMKSLGTNRLNPRIIAKDANAAYAVAEVLCSEKFGCDVEDMVKE